MSTMKLTILISAVSPSINRADRGCWEVNLDVRVRAPASSRTVLRVHGRFHIVVRSVRDEVDEGDSHQLAIVAG